MATRSVIKIEGMKAVIYKHWDGSVESTLPWLQDFNKRFTDKRGDDANYKFAQLLRDSAFSLGAFQLDDSRETGWGVFDEMTDCGQEFEYTLMTDGSVTVRAGYGLKMKKMTKLQILNAMGERLRRIAARAAEEEEAAPAPSLKLVE